MSDIIVAQRIVGLLMFMITEAITMATVVAQRTVDGFVSRVIFATDAAPACRREKMFCESSESRERGFQRMVRTASRGISAADFSD